MSRAGRECLKAPANSPEKFQKHISFRHAGVALCIWSLRPQYRGGNALARGCAGARRLSELPASVGLSRSAGRGADEVRSHRRGVARCRRRGGESFGSDRLAPEAPWTNARRRGVDRDGPARRLPLRRVGSNAGRTDRREQAGHAGCQRELEAGRRLRCSPSSISATIAEQEYFADGMVEEIITALSRMRWLFVIARNSSFTYKGRAVDVKQVGRELGVRYVLEGSVRKAGNRVRITGQLIDTSTGAHLWADRFDGGLEDIFDLQDQVTASVVGAIAPKLEAGRDRTGEAQADREPRRLRLLSARHGGFAQWTQGGQRRGAVACSTKPSNSTPISLRPMAWRRDATPSARPVVG